ncbi:Large cysteine-rich periplasmic protein OmcB, serovar C [bacterium HR36]|nr:Large cysteine-rich periplasmic protein OmcB, serovar C [bacterium HR36]
MKARGIAGWVACAVLGGLLLAGCLSHNPSYFPYLLPPGEVAKTHAKPRGRGYYENFDPYAVRLEVRPLQATNPVGGQQVLIATVLDRNGQPRRGRRVEWMLEGSGHILEVDESGYDAGRGWKEGDRLAVSYTSYREHHVTRGTPQPDDDFVIRPGQTWCVITSPVEGESHVTVYAPAIYNWEQRKVTVTLTWVDAAWEFPPPTSGRPGVPVQLVTRVFRRGDNAPLSGYRVRYTILEGPPAVFLPAQQSSLELPTDGQGLAIAQVMLAAAQPGTTRIGIEILRNAASGAATIVLARGETWIQWASAGLSLTKTGPANAAPGQNLTYVLTLTNTGPVETEAVTVRDLVPENLSFVQSQPAANVEGRELVWTLGPIAPGRSAAIQATFRAEKIGRAVNRCSATTADGLRTEAEAITEIAAPGLSVAVQGPNRVSLGMPVTLQITVTNTGSGPATNGMLRADFDPGLSHPQAPGTTALTTGPFTIAPGASRTETLVLNAVKEGTHRVRITATADGNLRSIADHNVQVDKPQVQLEIKVPAARYVSAPVEVEITVRNSGNAPASNLYVVGQLPVELGFVAAGEGGQFRDREVTWFLSQLPPGESRTFRITCSAQQLSPKAVCRAVLRSDAGVLQTTEAALEIHGAPGLRLEMVDIGDPLIVDSTVRYEINITNTGTLADSDVSLVAIIPPELEFIAGSGPGNTVPKLAGNSLTFPSVLRLEPGQVLVYQVQCRGKMPGDARFRIELRSASLGKEPLIREEATTVVAAPTNQPEKPQ